MGEGPVRDAEGRERPAADALADAGIAPVTLAEKEGLALINGTDGMLGMLVLAIDDLRTLLTTRRRRRGDERRGPARHGRRLRRRPPRAAPASRAGRLGGEPPRGARRTARSSPATAAPRTPASRTPTRCAARRRSHGGGARHARPRGASSPSGSSRPRSTTRSSPLDGRVESNGNFHGAPLALRPRLPRRRRGRRREHRRAAHRPLPRPRPQPRPARLPRARPRRRLRAA